MTTPADLVSTYKCILVKTTPLKGQTFKAIFSKNPEWYQLLADKELFMHFTPLLHPGNLMLSKFTNIKFYKEVNVIMLSELMTLRVIMKSMKPWNRYNFRKESKPKFGFFSKQFYNLETSSLITNHKNIINNLLAIF